MKLPKHPKPIVLRDCEDCGETMRPYGPDMVTCPACLHTEDL